jgi:hypothetical protein
VGSAATSSGRAAEHDIDSFVGRKIPAWLGQEGLQALGAEGHTPLYDGGSAYEPWWQLGLAEIADQLRDEGGIDATTLEEIHRCTTTRLPDDDDRLHGRDRSFGAQPEPYRGQPSSSRITSLEWVTGRRFPSSSMAEPLRSSTSSSTRTLTR